MNGQGTIAKEIAKESEISRSMAYLINETDKLEKASATLSERLVIVVRAAGEQAEIAEEPDPDIGAPLAREIHIVARRIELLRLAMQDGLGRLEL